MAHVPLPDGLSDDATATARVIVALDRSLQATSGRVCRGHREPRCVCACRGVARFFTVRHIASKADCAGAPSTNASRISSFALRNDLRSSQFSHGKRAFVHFEQTAARIVGVLELSAITHRSSDATLTTLPCWAARMSVPLEQIVKHLEDSGILAGDTLQDFIPPKASPKDGQELLRELVRQRKLTKFQAQQVWQGKVKSLVLGNYLLQEKIGQGGMGAVYKAEHRRMKRIVAVKMLPPKMLKNPDAVARFQREVRRRQPKLEHPNIVAAFDADNANGVHLLVMQYVEGMIWRRLVKRTDRYRSRSSRRFYPAGGQRTWSGPCRRGRPPRHQACQPAAR